MKSTTIIILTVIVLLVIGGVAFLLYKANFRATKLKVKTPLIEADLERKSSEPSTATGQTPARTIARQTATEGGVIRKSTIEAPAAAGADLSQEAKGAGSRVDDSEIKLS
jgi:hypothetical protein